MKILTILDLPGYFKRRTRAKLSKKEREAMLKKIKEEFNENGNRELTEEERKKYLKDPTLR